MNRSTSTIVYSTALAALFVGCGQKDGSIQPEGKPTATATATATAAMVESPPTAAPVDAHPEKPAPVAPLPVRLASEKLSLQIFAGKTTGSTYSSSALHVFPVGDRMVVGPGLRVLAEGRIVEMPGSKEVTLSGEDLAGAPSDKGLDEVELFHVIGRYPDDLWIDIESSWGFAVARSNAGTWTMRRYSYLRQFGKFGRVPDWPVAASPWSSRRTLAYLGEGRFRLALTNKKKPDPLPKQAAGKSCPVRVDGKSMMALPGGKVAVLGPDCDAGGALALERWGSASDEESLSKSEIVALPGAPSGKPRAAWVLLHEQVTYAVAHYDSRSYIAEIRGDKVVELESPYAHVADAHVAADGTLYLAGDETIYRYDGATDGKAVFTAAELPKKLAVKKQYGLFAESRDHVFWAVQPEAGSVILSTHASPDDTAPAASATSSASAAPAATSSASAAPPGDSAPAATTAAPQASAASGAAGAALLDVFPALTNACTTPLVVLFPVARSTPKDFDFAAAKADLKDYAGLADIKLVDLEYDGERFLAAVVKDAKSATALVAHLTAKKKEPAPKATCFPVPPSAREIR